MEGHKFPLKMFAENPCTVLNARCLVHSVINEFIETKSKLAANSNIVRNLNIEATVLEVKRERDGLTKEEAYKGDLL